MIQKADNASCLHGIFKMQQIITSHFINIRTSQIWYWDGKQFKDLSIFLKFGVVGGLKGRYTEHSTHIYKRENESP